MHKHTYTHKYTCACLHRPHAEALILRLTIYVQICIHIHIHMCINVYIHIYIHTCTHIYICMSAHIHTYTYTHTHVHNLHMHARLERRCGSERAWSRCRERKLCTSLSFDAIKPHFAPPMQGLHYTHFLKHQYSSEEAPRSFTMAPYVIVKRLEGKERCSRAAVSEHAGIMIQAQE